MKKTTNRLQLRNFCLFVLLLLAGQGLAQDAKPLVKQLAGPPSDFVDGTMMKSNGVETGVRSHSAMIPIRFTENGDGSLQWQGELAVETSPLTRMIVFSGENQWDVNLRAPFSKRAQTLEEVAYEVQESEFGMADQNFKGDYYVIEGINAGLYNLSVNSNGMNFKKQGGQSDGYILFSNKSDTRLYSYIADRNFIVGNEVNVVAYGFFKTDENMLKAPIADVDMVKTATLRVTSPSGQEMLVDMFDDGLHGDEAAGDGIFGGLFQLTETGDYQTQVMARGISHRGEAFVRTAEHVFPAVAADVQIADQALKTVAVSDTRVAFDIEIDSFYKEEQYRAYAEVWGSNEDGASIPVAWIGGMVLPENGQITMSLDTRWITLAGAQKPFELRNLSLQDVNNHIVLGSKDSIDLALGDLPAAAGRSVTGIDEAMLMGERPEMNNRAGSGLLLVHGYCSGDAWGPVAGQFSGERIFKDFNKNRSHDQFARLIDSYGDSQFSSYGIVAHSQGGAASLHLYTYYWSGLDNASGNRLIQSVGTPYQGTSLAGVLAALGGIFGAGCGTQNDLTYNGASAWLSGIPSWARNKVNYYTTSFDDRWWAYDYCNIASDLVLSDPDDGVIEKSKGQLSSGINRGHKEDWCHTTGMRDPAQTRDGSRNSTMNSQAAR